MSSKYDNLKSLKEKKARISHICDKCGQGIGSGEIYYKESVGKVNAPGLTLKGFCVKCYQQQGGKLLKETKKVQITNSTFGQ